MLGADARFVASETASPFPEQDQSLRQVQLQCTLCETHVNMQHSVDQISAGIQHIAAAAPLLADAAVLMPLAFAGCLCTKHR